MPKQPGEIYLELNVEYYLDDAVAGVGVEAEVLFVRGLCLARKLMTDGAIGPSQLRRLGADLADVEAAATALVNARLWRRAKAGYVISNFLKRNPSRAQIVARSEEKSIAGAYGNHVKYHADSPRKSCDWCSGRAQPPSSHQRPQERSHQRSQTPRSTDRTVAIASMSDPSTSTSTSTSESPSTSESGTEETPPTPSPAPRRRRAKADPAESLPIDITRRPDLQAMAKRGWKVSRKQADDLAELAANLETRPIDGMKLIASWIAEAPRKGDLQRLVLDRGNALRAERLAAADQREAAWNATKDQAPALSPAISRQLNGTNGHSSRLTREQLIEQFRTYRGQVDDALLEPQLARHGLSIADLEDPVDFGGGEAAPAHE